MSRTHLLIACGLVLGAAACVDRPAPVATDDGTPGVAGPVAAPGTAGPRPERLARLFAMALRSPSFRGYLKSQLDASPFPEHKIQLQRFLAAPDRRALRDVAEQNGTTEDDVQQEARTAIPLEVYLPVPAQRASWNGDENVLVATAIQDREAPVAFSPDGRRSILSPDTPPETPVIAVVPVETDFDTPPNRTTCLDCGSGGGGSTSSIGLFMTKSHFDDDYEGWLKGDPEYEIHVLGQSGSTDSLTDYQCAGEHAGGPYAFDQNANDWTGSVLLFSQQQLDSYKAAHPGQSLRVLALEDDDTACKIITNKDDLNRIFKFVDSVYSKKTGGRDTTITSFKFYKAARIIHNIWTLIASFIKTNDDLIGTAIEDKVVGTFYPGFNWIVKGQNNITHGWLGLEMR
ncbi:MAG TPA: hypothetical protein VIV10_14295 [Gemmatimonadales bacterium]